RKLLVPRRVGAVVAAYARTSTKPALRRIYTSPLSGALVHPAGRNAQDGHDAG
ncbi:hypothetical protein X777_06344, partial [Ooceraea biroi]